MSRRYRAYSDYLRERHGGPATRVAVDPGLGCPHRPGGGCAFCVSRSGATDTPPVEEQIRRSLQRPRRGRALLLYLQGGTGTHGSPEALRRIYDRALGQADFRELIVGTRPDCVDRERARLLGSYARPDRDVWVELGLQSADDATLRRIERGHGAAAFTTAVGLLRDQGIRVAAHLIHGLPGEDRDAFLRTVAWLANHDPDGVKIHNLHVHRGTPLASQYLRGELTVPTEASHLDAVARALELLPGHTVVMRLLTDCPQAALLAPRVPMDKSRFLRDLDDHLERHDMRQCSRHAAGAYGAQS